MSLVNMQMSAEEAKEDCTPTPADSPRYPWGLELSLDDDALAKLGITTLPAVGAKMTVNAVAVVTRTGAYQTQGAESETSMSLQITDMSLSAAEGPSTADVLYGAKG